MDYLYRMRETEESMLSPKSLGTEGMEGKFCVYNILTNRSEGKGNLELGGPNIVVGIHSQARLTAIPLYASFFKLSISKNMYMKKHFLCTYIYSFSNSFPI